MSEDVKRYAFVEAGRIKRDEHDDPTPLGNWVTLDDHNRTVAVLKAEIAEYKAAFNNDNNELAKAQLKIAELEQKLADITSDYLRRHNDACELYLERDALTARLAECEVDARRYRWLRKGTPNRLPALSASMRDGCGPHVVVTLPGVEPHNVLITVEALDIAIDAASQESKT